MSRSLLSLLSVFYCASPFISLLSMDDVLNDVTMSRVVRLLFSRILYYARLSLLPVLSDIAICYVQ
jgi:hypothetical protein